LLSGKANGSLLSYIQLWKIVPACWQKPVLSIITAPTTDRLSWVKSGWVNDKDGNGKSGKGKGGSGKGGMICNKVT
jgi:hypothetical protein